MLLERTRDGKRRNRMDIIVIIIVLFFFFSLAQMDHFWKPMHDLSLLDEQRPLSAMRRALRWWSECVLPKIWYGTV